MTKYRKKPVVVKAFQLGKDPMPDWFMDAVTRKDVTLHMSAFDGDKCAIIKTLEGDHRANAEQPGRPGDFVILGIKGELYPCKPDIFEATCEPVEDTDRGMRDFCDLMADADSQDLTVSLVDLAHDLHDTLGRLRKSVTNSEDTDGK